mmetsp:Transcript_5195/g.6786  ORF Transcript_5195/g.6786 Transcript_5195/m.6786 type:complete len:335 (+) Transcript_5195:19-1023(+)
MNDDKVRRLVKSHSSAIKTAIKHLPSVSIQFLVMKLGKNVAPTVSTTLSLLLLLLLESSDSFILRQATTKQNLVVLRAESGRRTFFASVGMAVTGLILPSQSYAEEDLTTQLFYEDGSLKDGVESEAKFRQVEFVWDGSASSITGSYQINIDGFDAKKLSSEGESVKISYDMPLKWKGPGETGANQDLYTDLTVKGEDVKALTKITVYQAPEPVKQQQLEKASTIGIAKAINVLPELEALQTADLVGGRVRTVGSNKQMMFDFDMAVAPKTCGNSPENLGLGFCPFDTVFLLTATIVNERLYVFAIECDKDQWKRSNSDLKKVRSTFAVSSILL